MFILKFVRYGKHGDTCEWLIVDGFSTEEYENYLVVIMKNRAWRIDNSSNTWNVCHVLNSKGELIEKLNVCPWNAKGALDSLKITNKKVRAK